MASKKRVIHSFNVVADAANKLDCKDLHHKRGQYHDPGEVCPAKYDLSKHINRLHKYIKDNLK